MLSQAARNFSTRVPNVNAARVRTRPVYGPIYISPHGISRNVLYPPDGSAARPSSRKRSRNVWHGRLLSANAASSSDEMAYFGHAI